MLDIKCPKCQGLGNKQLIDYANQFICLNCHFSCPMAHYAYKIKQAQDKAILAVGKRLNGVWVVNTPKSTNISLTIK